MPIYVNTSGIITDGVSQMQNSGEYNESVALWIQAHPGYFLWNSSSMFWYTVIVMLLTSGVLLSVVYWGQIVALLRRLGSPKKG
jgi:hypothetical protein